MNSNREKTSKNVKNIQTMEDIKVKLDIHDLYFQSQEDRLMKLEKLLLDGGQEIEEGKPENEMLLWKGSKDPVISHEKFQRFEQCVIDHCGYLVREGSDKMQEHCKAFHPSFKEKVIRTAYMDDQTYDEIMESWLADLKGKRPRPGSKKTTAKKPRK